MGPVSGWVRRRCPRSTATPSRVCPEWAPTAAWLLPRRDTWCHSHPDSWHGLPLPRPRGRHGQTLHCRPSVLPGAAAGGRGRVLLKARRALAGRWRRRCPHSGVRAPGRTGGWNPVELFEVKACSRVRSAFPGLLGRLGSAGGEPGRAVQCRSPHRAQQERQSRRSCLQRPHVQLQPGDVQGGSRGSNG